MGLIELFDFVVGCVEAWWSVAPGVPVLGMLLLLASGPRTGAPFWQQRAWD